MYEFDETFEHNVTLFFKSVNIFFEQVMHIIQFLLHRRGTPEGKKGTAGFHTVEI